MNASVLWDIVSRAKIECHEAAGRLLFTFKSFKKTLANNTEKKNRNYLRARHNDISNFSL